MGMTININTDLKCVCGEYGICDNGLCIECNTKNIKENGMPLSQQLNDEACERAIALIAIQLRANWKGICKMRDLAAVNSDAEKFVHSTAISVKQVPKGDAIDVKVTVSASAALKDETDYETVDNQPNLSMD